MYERLGNTVTRHWLATILAWLGTAIFLSLICPSWNSVTQDGDLAHLPDDLPAQRGEQLLQETFPGDRSKSEVVIVVARDDGPLRSEDYVLADTIGAHFRSESVADLPILDVWTRNSEVIGAQLRAKNKAATLIVLQLGNEFMAVDNMRVLDRIQAELSTLRQGAPEGLEVGISGSAAIGGDMLASARESLRNTELTTVAMVLLILLIVYRSPLLAVVPLITIALSIIVATSLLAWLTQLGDLWGLEWWNFKVFSTTRIFIVVVLFGAGTDFCLFLIARYEEELGRGLDSVSAVSASIARIGDALLASALTTIAGLATMYFANFGKYASSGPAIGIALAITLLSCLTLAPALLRAWGSAVFWPAMSFRSTAKKDAFGEARIPQFPLPWSNRIWQRVAGLVVQRPGMVFSITALILLPFAVRGRHVDVTYDLLSELRMDRPSVRGTRLLQRHFPAGETQPVTVVAIKHDGQFHEKEGQADIAWLTKRLYGLEEIERVRSMTEPLGDRPGSIQLFSGEGLRKLGARNHETTERHFLSETSDGSDNATRLEVILRTDAFSENALAALNSIDRELAAVSQSAASPWQGARFEIAGTAAAIRDLRSVTQDDLGRIQVLVTLAVFIIIVAILRRPAICALLIASVLFSYLVTLGITETVFVAFYGDTYHGLDWKLPLFLFVILVAVGQDYNIYLVTRVFEEQKQHGTMRGLREGIVKTGGIITSCGVIMAATFSSMMTGSLRGMTELGFALSFGILLDTFIVRPVLVPCCLAGMARWKGTDAGSEENLSPRVPFFLHRETTRSRPAHSEEAKLAGD